MKQMQTFLVILAFVLAVTAAIAAPFTPHEPEEAYGVGSFAWRFASHLTRDASGRLEICYAEAGGRERVLGTVEIRPFRSSETKRPDLRILFAKAKVDGKERIVLLVGYGIRSGVLVADVPGLTDHALVVAGSPQANSSGEFTLLGYGDGAVTINPDGLGGVRGRLFFRYTGGT